MRGGKPQEPQIPIDYWQNFPDQSLGSSHIKQIFPRKSGRMGIAVVVVIQTSPKGK